MEPPTEYADVMRGHTQVLALPVNDTLERKPTELPLINNMQQQSSRVGTRVSKFFMLCNMLSIMENFHAARCDHIVDLENVVIRSTCAKILQKTRK